jgi:hypothetical protein
MKKKNMYVVLLRIVHGLFAAFFISCIAYLYYAVVTLQINFLLILALGSLIFEGVIVFILNKGDCPLIHIQKKLDDPVPFFNLFLPDYFARKAISFFTIVTVVGFVVLIVRLTYNVGN